MIDNFLILKCLFFRFRIEEESRHQLSPWLWWACLCQWPAL